MEPIFLMFHLYMLLKVIFAIEDFIAMWTRVARGPVRRAYVTEPVLGQGEVCVADWTR